MKRILLFSALFLLPIPASAEDSSPAEIAKLIERLGADDLSTREDAADRLFALRKSSEAPLTHRGPWLRRRLAGR